MVFCLFCLTGKESAVEETLVGLGCEAVPQLVERPVFRRETAGKTRRRKELRRLLPGYVLAECPAEPDWRALRAVRGVLRPLCYPDGERALRGGDLEFVRWLYHNKAGLGLSRVLREGTRIKVIDGPLKEYEGQIIRVNHRRKCAQILVTGDGIINTVWLGFEVLSTAE